MSGGGGDGSGTGDATSVGLGDQSGGLAAVAAAANAAIGNYGFGNTVSGFAPASVSANTSSDPGNTTLGGYYGTSTGPQGTVTASPPGYASNADAAAAAAAAASMGVNSANSGLGTAFGQATPGGQVGSSVTTGIANTAPANTNFGTNFGRQGNQTGIGSVGFVNGNDPGLAASKTGQAALAQSPLANLSPQQHQALVQALQALFSRGTNPSASTQPAYGGGGIGSDAVAGPQSGMFGQVSPHTQQAMMSVLAELSGGLGLTTGIGAPSISSGQNATQGAVQAALYGSPAMMGDMSIGQMAHQTPAYGANTNAPSSQPTYANAPSPQAQNTNGPMGSLGFPGTQGYTPAAGGGQGRGMSNPSQPHLGYGGAYGFAGLNQ